MAPPALAEEQQRTDLLPGTNASGGGPLGGVVGGLLGQSLLGGLLGKGSPRQIPMTPQTRPQGVGQAEPVAPAGPNLAGPRGPQESGRSAQSDFGNRYRPSLQGEQYGQASRPKSAGAAPWENRAPRLELVEGQGFGTGDVLQGSGEGSPLGGLGGLAGSTGGTPTGSLTGGGSPLSGLTGGGSPLGALAGGGSPLGGLTGSGG
ncbi:hypothetical protein HII36_49950, partial [Nonomuraea sp. NN258]|nr:hypothetical protein [Nonomuraea antri]